MQDKETLHATAKEKKKDKNMKRFAAILLIIALSGCYHVTVRTGKTLSSHIIERNAPSFVLGLTPADVDAGCPHGVAIVETERGFLDHIATWLSFGLYSPSSVRVTCAK